MHTASYRGRDHEILLFVLLSFVVALWQHKVQSRAHAEERAEKAYAVEVQKQNLARERELTHLATKTVENIRHALSPFGNWVITHVDRTTGSTCNESLVATAIQNRGGRSAYVKEYAGTSQCVSSHTRDSFVYIDDGSGKPIRYDLPFQKVRIVTTKEAPHIIEVFDVHNERFTQMGEWQTKTQKKLREVLIFTKGL